jgi:hypothetical protein
MYKTRLAVDIWLDSSENESDRLSVLQIDVELDRKVRALANLFQELGVAYARGVVDRATIRNNFDFLVPHYWTRLNFWVRDKRSHLDKNLYRRFEAMASKFL